MPEDWTPPATMPLASRQPMWHGAPVWVWIVGGVVGGVVLLVAIGGAISGATSGYSHTSTFGSLRITVSEPKLSGNVLSVPLTLVNTEGKERYDYDANSFTVNLAARGKLSPRIGDGVGTGTLAPNESRKVALLFDVPAGGCPNNLHFQAAGGSPSAGDIALQDVGC